MRAALIGLPYSGKTAVFEALTGLEAGKKEESIGTIRVPDHRIDALDAVFHPKRKVYAEFIISDFLCSEGRTSPIPAKIKGLAQKTDLLLFVLRNFDSMLASEGPAPLAEYQKIKEDLVFTDFCVIEKRLEREQKEHKNTKDIAVIKKLLPILEKGSFPPDDFLSQDEYSDIVHYSFLSLKKRIVLINQSEGQQAIPENLKQELDKDGTLYFSVSAPLEKELIALPKEEQKEFLQSYGLTETAKDKLIQEAYRTLGLISFLTSGEDEVRAWPIRKGITAVLAAEKIHSDIARGFIRAETVHFADFIRCGSEAECKKAGLYRLEGKEYIVQDGDIICFRFNV